MHGSKSLLGEAQAVEERHDGTVVPLFAPVVAQGLLDQNLVCNLQRRAVLLAVGSYQKALGDCDLAMDKVLPGRWDHRLRQSVS